MSMHETPGNLPGIGMMLTRWHLNEFLRATERAFLRSGDAPRDILRYWESWKTHAKAFPRERVKSHHLKNLREQVRSSSDRIEFFELNFVVGVFVNGALRGFVPNNVPRTEGYALRLSPLTRRLVASGGIARAAGVA